MRWEPGKGVALLALHLDRLTGSAADARVKEITQLPDNFNDYRVNVVGTSDVVAKLFEAEGRGLYSVRQAVIGHVQQGGQPSPFDRINATRLAYQAVANLSTQLAEGSRDYVAASSVAPGMMAPLRSVTDGMDWDNQRPHAQWWMALRSVFDQLSRRPGQE